jgi:hypothetical protein
VRRIVAGVVLAFAGIGAAFALTAGPGITAATAAAPAAPAAASASASGAPASAGPPAAADGERAAAYASPAARAPALVSSASGRTVASASCRRRRIDLVFQRFGIGAGRLDRRRGLDRALGGGLRRRRGSGRAWLLCARICSGITFVLRERPESSARADD